MPNYVASGVILTNPMNIKLGQVKQNVMVQKQSCSCKFGLSCLLYWYALREELGTDKLFVCMARNDVTVNNEDGVTGITALNNYFKFLHLLSSWFILRNNIALDPVLNAPEVLAVLLGWMNAGKTLSSCVPCKCCLAILLDVSLTWWK